MEDAVSTDVLGDAAGLACGDLGLADGIQQRGLAVIDVAHERDDRCAKFKLLLHLFLGRRWRRLDDDFLDLVDAAALLTLVTLELEAVLLTDFLGDLDVDGLVRAGEDLEGDEIRDDLEGAQAHLLGQILDDDRRLEMDDLLTRLGQTRLSRSLVAGVEREPVRLRAGWAAAAGRIEIGRQMGGSRLRSSFRLRCARPWACRPLQRD